ncbi:MAG: type II and III secretion system protein family protein [Pseudomonadota bacterium]
MKRLPIAKALLASLAMAPLAATPTATVSAQESLSPTDKVVLSIGRGKLISVPGSMADVFIANDSIADVQVKSQSQLYVFGRSGGETTIYASDAAGRVIWSANVRVGSNIDSLDQMLALAMPEAKIGVATMGSNAVLLTGTVAAPEDAAEAERLVQAFLGGNANVISRLKTATPLQVNLKVTFAEVSRTLVRSIGGSLSTYDFSTGGFRGALGSGRQLGTGNFRLDGPLAVGNGVQNPGLFVPQVDANGNFVVDANGVIQTETITGPGLNTNGGTTLGGLGRLFGLDVLGALDLAEQVGLVTTLSEPNLTALSGETASFLAGGEFPIPISEGLGSVSVQYRDFGVSLEYTPTVLSNGRISLRVSPEVSELSSAGSVQLNGFEIPGLTIRRTETTVELGSGQSFMIAGLMSNNSQNSLDRAPGLGDMPILGNLFRSRSYRRGDTELVIIVTPYLVKPVSAGEISLPTDGYHAASEAAQFLGYQQHAGQNGEKRPGPTAADGAAPPPGVSLGPDGNIPGSTPDEPKRAEKEDRAKNRKKDERSANSAAPGFSL